MAHRTIGDLKTESLLGFNANVYGSYVDNWLKDAAEEIALRAQGADQIEGTLLATITTPNTSVPLNTGTSFHTINPYGVRLIDANGLNLGTYPSPLSITELENLPTSISDTPVYWSFSGGSIYVWPSPASTIRLKISVNTSVADNVVWGNASSLGQPGGLLADWFADTMVCYVRSKLFRYEDDVQMAGFWEQQYERNLAKVANEYSRRLRPEPRQVRGTWGPRTGGRWWWG